MLTVNSHVSDYVYVPAYVLISLLVCVPVCMTEYRLSVPPVLFMEVVYPMGYHLIRVP
jgi:hypothetical protein